MPPLSGTIPLNIDKLDGIILGGNGYIGTRSQALSIRKKFDTKNWNGKVINTKSFNLVPDGEVIALKIDEKTNGFTYCELRTKKGKIIITTWDIINGAKISPTPVYLLKEILMKD